MRMSVKIDYHTKLFGLVGYPLEHSLLSQVQNSLYEAFNINAVFMPFEVPKGSLDAFITATKVLRMQMFCVTSPHKGSMLPYVDDAEQNCKTYNCINYVVTDETGRRFGYGLDGFGVGEDIEDHGCVIKGRQALLLGAGGVSGVVADEMIKRGISKLVVLNRTAQKAEELAKLVSANNAIQVEAGPLTNEMLDKYAPDTQLLLQCTTQGMLGSGVEYSSLDFIDKLPPECFIAEALYNPYQTKLLQKALERGLQGVNGMGMMACQMKRLFQIVFGINISEKGKQIATETLKSELSKRNAGK
jgi:shikimate dehydrogenase